MSQLASSKRSFWPKRLPAEESWSIPLLFSHLVGGLTPIYTDDTDGKHPPVENTDSKRGDWVSAGSAELTLYGSGLTGWLLLLSIHLLTNGLQKCDI
jgi:hypothetical protein